MQMHAGTQTLIQALQALPWVEDPDDVDEPISRIDLQTDSDSDGEPTGRKTFYPCFGLHVAEPDYRCTYGLLYSRDLSSCCPLETQGHITVNLRRKNVSCAKRSR